MTAPLLHGRFPRLAQTLPHRRLGTAPTPVRRLPALSEALRAETWVKAEGDFGDGGWGGNKVRKLEWLLADVLRRGRRSVLTFGGLGTNWGLATALYGAEAGIDVALALVDQPVDDHVRAQLARLEASGATIHRTHTPRRTVAALPWLLARHARGGRTPYLMPAGGSSPLGAVGQVEVGLEIAAQVRAGELPEPAWVVAPVGTGGTVAGVSLGLRIAGLPTRVLGAVVNDQLRLDDHIVLGLAERAAGLLRERGAGLGPVEPSADHLVLTRGQLGPGYGHSTAAGAAAAELAGADGLDLDPVYTAKAMAALRDLRTDGPVLFLHTDGPR